MFIVLKAGQTQLRCQHVNRRAFSLYIVNPQLPGFRATKQNIHRGLPAL
jgi:hypothetical protein